MSSELFRKFAEELKATREKKEVTLQQISNKTRINIKFLEAIEEGNFSVIDEIYIRAFLREYAQQINLDENEILKRYDQCKAGRIDEPEKSDSVEVKKEDEPKKEELETPQSRKMVLEEQKPKPKSKPPKQKKEKSKIKEKKEVFSEESHKKVIDVNSSEKDSNLPSLLNGISKNLNSIKGNTPVLSGIAVGLLIIFVIVYFTFIRESKPEIINERPYEEVVQQQAQKSEVEAHKKTVHETTLDSLTLTIAASDTSWIRVVLDDAKAEEFILLPGLSKQLKAGIDFNLLIGNSGGIELYLNEKSLDFKGKAGGVRNIVVDKNGYRQATTREPSTDE